MTDLFVLSLCFAAGCVLWTGLTRHGLAVLDRWRASDALALLLALQVTRVAVRLAAGASPTALVALAAVVSALSFASLAALRSDQPQARGLVWATVLLGGLDLVAAFADAFVGGAISLSAVQVTLSGLYVPALVVTQVLLFRTLLRPEAAASPALWHTSHTRIPASAFTPGRQSR